MKNICLWIGLLLLLQRPLCAQIKNGYADDFAGAQSSLKHLTSLLKTPFLTPAERKKLEHGKKATTDNIVHYQLTQQLLADFRLISPDLYNEIDTLADDHGRKTVVYVKFVPDENNAGTSHGVTYLTCMPKDSSETSQMTEVSIQIEIRIARKALVVLAHEFGHLRYIIPHLTDYLEYYSRTYSQIASDPDFAGHNESDVSGKTAEAFEKRYRLSRYSHWKAQEKVADPVSIAMDIRKRLVPIDSSTASLKSR
jgi:hypothetical protein